MNLDGTLLLELPGPRVLIMMNARIVSPPPDMDERRRLRAASSPSSRSRPEHFLIGDPDQWEIQRPHQDHHPGRGGVPVRRRTRRSGTSTSAPRPRPRPAGRGRRARHRQRHRLPDVQGRRTARIPVRQRSRCPRSPGFAHRRWAWRASFTWGNTDVGLYLGSAAAWTPNSASSRSRWRASSTSPASCGCSSCRSAPTPQLTVLVAEQPAGDDLNLSIHGQACGHVELLLLLRLGLRRHLDHRGPTPRHRSRRSSRRSRSRAASPALAQGSGVDRGIDTSLGEAPEQTGVPADSAMPVGANRRDPGDLDDRATGRRPSPSADSAPRSPPPRASPPTASPSAPATATTTRSPASRLERIDRQRQPTRPCSPAVPGRCRACRVVDDQPPAQASPVAAARASSPGRPPPATKAIENTERLIETINERWGTVCSRPRRAAEVLWTFRLEPLGPSASGWDLEGVAWPDPAGTVAARRPARTARRRAVAHRRSAARRAARHLPRGRHRRERAVRSRRCPARAPDIRDVLGTTADRAPRRAPLARVRCQGGSGHGRSTRSSRRIARRPSITRCGRRWRAWRCRRCSGTSPCRRSVPPLRHPSRPPRWRCLPGEGARSADARQRAREQLHRQGHAAHAGRGRRQGREARPLRRGPLRTGAYDSLGLLLFVPRAIAASKTLVVRVLDGSGAETDRVVVGSSDLLAASRGAAAELG